MAYAHSTELIDCSYFISDTFHFPQNPMTDPGMMTDMLKGNVTNVLPMIVIGGWINWMFSGFLTSKWVLI